MKKRVMFVFGLTAFLLVAFFTFFQREAKCVEPESYQSLAHEKGEERTNGDDEFFLPMSAELK